MNFGLEWLPNYIKIDSANFLILFLAIDPQKNSIIIGYIQLKMHLLFVPPIAKRNKDKLQIAFHFIVSAM